jgi:hypothetical protein
MRKTRKRLAPAERSSENLGVADATDASSQSKWIYRGSRKSGDGDNRTIRADFTLRT